MTDKVTKVTVPRVHLNGTSFDDLYQQAAQAGASLRYAIQALDEMAPNGRDYYPQGEDALSRAQAEHRARVERVRSVLDEVCAIAEAIADQEREVPRDRA